LISDVDDLYFCDYQKLEGEKGFGEKKIALIQDGIKKSLLKPYVTVLSSLGIPELGKKAAELLINAGLTSIDDLLSIAGSNDVGRLTEIHGIGERTAEIIITEFGRTELIERISRLKEAGLKFEADESELRVTEGVFAGQSWAVTGSFDNFKPRELALDEIKKRGGSTVSTITGKTSHLLCGKGGGSKRTKAEKLGAVIVEEDQFMEMINDD
jgi:DNA ligase (NAD+)